MIKAKQIVKSLIPGPRPRQFLVMHKGFPGTSGKLIPFKSLKDLKVYLKSNKGFYDLLTILELTPSLVENEPNYTIINPQELK